MLQKREAPKDIIPSLILGKKPGRLRHRRDGHASNQRQYAVHQPHQGLSPGREVRSLWPPGIGPAVYVRVPFTAP